MYHETIGGSFRQQTNDYLTLGFQALRGKIGMGQAKLERGSEGNIQPYIKKSYLIYGRVKRLILGPILT